MSQVEYRTVRIKSNVQMRVHMLENKDVDPSCLDVDGFTITDPALADVARERVIEALTPIWEALDKAGAAFGRGGFAERGAAYFREHWSLDEGKMQTEPAKAKLAKMGTLPEAVLYPRNVSAGEAPVKQGATITFPTS